MISTLLSGIASSIVFKVIKDIFSKIWKAIKWFFKDILGRILAWATAAVIFCLVIMFVPIKRVSDPIPNYELTYIFVDDDNNEYNIFEKTHWAATDWSFLFDEDYEANEEWTINNEEWTVNDEKWQEDSNEEWITNNEGWQEDSYPTAQDEDTISTHNNVWLENIDYVWEVKKTYSKCTTPWWVVVEHWDYILAYQQRDDVPDVCNVQKRRCNDWVLDWSFTQWYCREDVEYNYKREKVVAHNTASQKELIQNPKYAKNDGAEFDTHWKIQWEWNTPTTIWDNNDSDPLITWRINKDQNQKNYVNCETPRWELVAHGQFIKAYASPLGFTDDACKTELRLCMDGELQWTYSYQNCKYTGIPYSDFIDGDKTIFNLYSEAYNLTNGWVWYLSDMEQLYDDAQEVYGEDVWGMTLEEIIADLQNTHWSNEGWNSYNKRSFFQQIWDRLVSLF